MATKKEKQLNYRVETEKEQVRIYVPVSELRYFDNNPKKFASKQFGKLTKSIKKNGIRENLLVNQPTMTVLNGNQRLKVAMTLGFKEVPVTFLNVPKRDEGKVLAELNECLMAKDEEAMVELLKQYQDDELMAMFLKDYENYKKSLKKAYNPEFEIVKEVDESFDYVVFVFKKSVDFLNAETFFNLNKVYDQHKEKLIGIGRVIDGDELLKLVALASGEGFKNINELE